MKQKSLLCTMFLLFVYFIQNILFSLFVGSFNANEDTAQFISCSMALCALLLLIANKRRAQYFGLCKPNSIRAPLLYIALLFIPFGNLLYFLIPGNIILEDIMMVVFRYGLYVGIIEEVIFRGFLFRAIQERSNDKCAIAISSIIFGLFHLVNLGNIPIELVILQVVYAIAVGICFSVLFVISKSILPCIIIHALTNILAFLCIENQQLHIELVGTSIIVAAAILSVFILIKYTRSQRCDE